MTVAVAVTVAPSALDPSGATGKPLGQCKGWVPNNYRPPGGFYGYATDDIFYLETCILSAICANADELFRLDAGELFSCQVEAQRVRDLQRVLVRPRPARSGE
mgnify:CR=1 FL=1